MKYKKDNTFFNKESFYQITIIRNNKFEDEPEYLRKFGDVLLRINSVFNTEKMKQHVRKIVADNTMGSLECDLYGLSHLNVMFKSPYFTLTKSCIV